MKTLITLSLLFLSVQLPAQLLKKLKEKVVDKGKGTVNDAKYDAKVKARNAAHKQLDDFNDAFDSTDIDYAILLSDNSGMFGGKGRGEFGVKFRQFGNIASSLLKDANLSDEENARLNLQLGQSGYAMGRLPYAEKKLDAAKNYFEKASLTNDPGYIKTISSKGLLYASMGRYEQARIFTTEALELRKQKIGNNSMAVAASLNNFAVLNYSLGQYNESEKQFEETLSIITANKQNLSMPYAIVQNNKAILFQSMGRYQAAATLLEDAIKLFNRSELRKATSTPKFFSNLALLYQQMGKYTEAERIYQGLEVRLEKTSSSYANMLNNLSILYLVMKKEEKVEAMLKQSAAIYKNTLGETNPAYAKVISDLGNFLRFKGRYEEAAPMLEGVLKSREQSLGVNHPLYVQSQEDLAILLWKKKDYTKAYQLYHDLLDKSLDFINKYFGPMSESEKTKYWDILSPRFQRFYSFAIETGATNNAIVNDMFEYRLATKGLLLNSTRKVAQSILSSGNEKLVTDYTAWIDAKEHLTALYGYSKEELKEQGVNVDSLETATNKMEKRLSENSKEFSEYFFTNKITFSQVQNKLKAEEALVEIIRLREYDQVFTDGCKYLAMVVTKKDSKPELILLPAGNDMESKFSKAYRLSMKNKIPDEKSYTNYWAPIDPLVKGKKNIYVSLDGVYNQINLNTLKKPGGDFLISLYDFVLLGNGRDLVINEDRKSNAQGKKATLIGFPIYGSASIPKLPATKTEVNGINKLLKSSGYSVSEWLQQEATESNLKATQKNSILHIATHGYFLQDIEKASWPLGVHADYAKDNVLLRSGLMLTGASDADKTFAGLENSSNGIITSYEAMNLDLKGTNLVVLSACETGLGEIKAGEGVYGLQRAFLVAGAEAIIMSLWKVDDAATQLLMNNFYENWTKAGDKQKAFKQAQLQLMAKYKEPYYWGAFVMMED
jgi:CHAT domain-containing protein